MDELLWYNLCSYRLYPVYNFCSKVYHLLSEKSFLNSLLIYSLLPFNFLNLFSSLYLIQASIQTIFIIEQIATRQVKTSVTAPNTTRRVMTIFAQFFFNCIQIYIDSKVYTFSVFKSQILSNNLPCYHKR